MPNTHSTLTSLFSDIADSIRAKTGSSDTIVADDFPDAIDAIPTGGGDTPPVTPNDAVIVYSKYPFSIKKVNSTKTWNGALYYSTDYSTWTEWDATTPISSALSSGYHKIYLRGTGNTRLAKGTGENDVATLSFSGKSISLCGNLNNLLSYTGNVSLASYAFYRLFYGCGNVDFNVELPATTLASSCYHYMFYGCTSLTTAPALPATTLASNCYRSMFYGCTSLTTAPALPATTLAGICYRGMFYGCTSLTTAPALPATTLAEQCYYHMFYGCTSLTTAPALPAKTLANYCYSIMFYGCTSLTTAPALPAKTLAEECYYHMFYSCSKIKLSTTQGGEYVNEYRIPVSGQGTTAPNALTDMFSNTGGTFTGTPAVNTTYYTSNTVIA